MKENLFEAEEALLKLQAVVDCLHTAGSGADVLEAETLVGIAIVMSDLLQDIRTALGM